MKELENHIEKIVDKILEEEINNKTNSILKEMEEVEIEAEVVDGEIDEMEEFYEIAKKRKEGRTNKKSEEEVLENNKHILQLTEAEMIDLIERIIKEQKIEGTTTQTKAMKTSGKEGNEYIKSVAKKLKDYLKDGSMGTYEENPEEFPKGNGDLKDMEKKAYTPSDGVEEYIENVAYAGGNENLEYDGIEPDEEWLDKNIVGSPETGNDPEWGNAVKTDVNDTVKKRKDRNLLAKIKKQSYNRANQPVTDFAGEKKKDGKMVDMDIDESKEEKKVITDVDRMKNIIKHNYRTQ